jgi:hypothetical protein
MSWSAVVAAVARRPRLWRAAARQARLLAPTAWWRRPPFLPVPDRAWMRFRSETQYGDPDRIPAPHDVVAWLEWERHSAHEGHR